MFIETFVWTIIWAIVEPFVETFVETIVRLPSISVLRVSRALELHIKLQVVPRAEL